MALVRRRRAPGPPAGSSPDAGPEPGVLELRVHGVNNTPPQDLLDLPLASVEQVAGDDLGSFWRPTATALERLGPRERGYVPPGVVREAYSWGGLARSSPGAGAGAVRVVIGALARTGWALLLPFGLVNVAFWSRRLDDGGGYQRGWQDGGSAAAVRVFALCLTLLSLGTAAVVSLDLVATQCFADGARWCARLPPALDGFASMTHGQRLALASVVPLLVLVLLAGLSAASRSRYEQLAALPSTTPVPVERGTPILATPGFWSNARLTSSIGRMHMAGGLCFLVLATAWHQVFATGDACATAGDVVGAGSRVCWAQAFPLGPTAVPFAVTLTLAVCGLVACAVWLMAPAWGAVALPGTRQGARLTRRATWFLAACGLLFVTHLVLLATVDQPTASEVPLLGLVVTPVLLVATMLGIALAARSWRRTTDRRHEAWGGRGPAVFLLLALGVGLTLSSVAVIGVGDWLNGSRSAGDLLRGGIGLPGSVPAPDRDGCTQVCPVPDPQLMIPSVYVWFGAATFVALGVVLLLAVRAAQRTSRTLPAAGEVPRGLGRRQGRGGSIDELSSRPGAREAVQRARRAAGVAHRAEPVTGVLALATAVCTGLAVVFAVTISFDPDLGPPQLRRVAADSVAMSAYAGLVDTAAWGAGIVGVLIMGGLVGGAATGRTRPLGLAWDLICFLPRTGHPFGPPCYAERVVPELVRRYVEWVEPPRAPSGRSARDPGPGRRVVVAAHSLGAVLTVASILAARAEHGAGLTDRLSVLTFGTQLRPYFGRMFPELLGPGVLGSAHGRGARLLTPDPWQDALEDDAEAARAPTVTTAPAGERPAPVEAASSRGAWAPWTVAAILTAPGADLAPRWVNLWRRTDYLGFPLDGYVASRFDRPAEEIDTSGYLPAIGTHSGYPRSGAYARAFEVLAGLTRPG
ncbi:MAG: hypothetical protein HGA44_09960 [Cellulomonadaceae bacterium]|nr:hypothetical protein [Cellulomonadaceae bacterium]